MPSKGTRVTTVKKKLTTTTPPTSKPIKSTTTQMIMSEKYVPIGNGTMYKLPKENINEENVTDVPEHRPLWEGLTTKMNSSIGNAHLFEDGSCGVSNGISELNL